MLPNCFVKQAVLSQHSPSSIIFIVSWCEGGHSRVNILWNQSADLCHGNFDGGRAIKLLQPGFRGYSVPKAARTECKQADVPQKVENSFVIGKCSYVVLPMVIFNVWDSILNCTAELCLKRIWPWGRQAGPDATVMSLVCGLPTGYKC